MNEKKISIFLIFLFLLVGTCFYLIYKIEFEDKVETKHYVNEITKLKVDSCVVSESFSRTTYNLYVSDKYLIRIDSIRYIPFERKERVDFCVIDKNSNYVIANWRKYWQKDIDKLMEYTTENIESFNK